MSEGYCGWKKGNCIVLEKSEQVLREQAEENKELKKDLKKHCLDKQRVRKARAAILILVHSRQTNLITDKGLKNGCINIFKELGLEGEE